MCAYDLNSSIYQSLERTGVDLLDIQAQAHFERCLRGHPDGSRSCQFRIYDRQLRKGQNPSIVVAAQFSFRYTPPTTIVTAINQLRGVVDAFYLAYPIQSAIGRNYRSPDNLAVVLQSR